MAAPCLIAVLKVTEPTFFEVDMRWPARRRSVLLVITTRLLLLMVEFQCCHHLVLPQAATHLNGVLSGARSLSDKPASA
jgi:hypothetical protein